MSINKGLNLLIAACLIFIFAKTAFSQEPNAQLEAAASNAQPEAAAPTIMQEEPDTQWVWGEVANLDTENKIIVVKYLDYETDQEKEVSIGVNDVTTYENIKSFDEIKPQDAVSIDYTVSPDGKNMAKNISLEKPESQPAPPQGNAAAAGTEVAPENKPLDTSTEAVPQETQPQETQPPMPKEQQ